MSKPTYDPYSVINLVMQALARDGVKNHFTGAELGEAVPLAERLLTAFGVTPFIPPYDDIPDRKEVPTST